MRWLLRMHQESLDMLQILFTGDTAFGGNYQKRIERKGGVNVLKEKGYDFGFSNLQPLIDDSQFVLANLETTLTTARSSPLKGLRRFIHRDSPNKSARALEQHGIDAVSLGNNHGFDYGDVGLAETREALERRGITVVGAGPNDRVAREPIEHQFYSESSVFRLAVIAGKHKWREYKYHYYADESSPGVNCWTEETAHEQIRALRESNPQAFLVAYPHWGQNYAWKDESQASLAQALVEAGADLVIGHGAHALQEIERIDGRWVVYGLGNFLFNSPGSYQRQKILPYGLAAALRVAEREGQQQLSLRLYPILSDNGVQQLIMSLKIQFGYQLHLKSECKPSCRGDRCQKSVVIASSVAKTATSLIKYRAG
jgi:hypothetical protein